MKNLNIIILVGALFALIMLLAGCTTKTIITKFDKDGYITEKIETEKDIFEKITDSTKNKTIIAWSDGWAGYISISTATTEDPTPTGKIFAGKVAKGYISLLKDQSNLANIANIILATKSDLSLTTFGINNNSSKIPDTTGKVDTAKPDSGTD